MLPKILTGFDKDLKKLFVKYEKESTTSFEKFSEIWNSLHYELIYSERDVKQSCAFFEEAFIYTKNFIIQSTSFLRKICCLYILYGLYYLQPVKGYVKIVLQYDEWLFFKEFLEILKGNDQKEATYIFLKLYNEHAFRFGVLDRYEVDLINKKDDVNYTDIVHEDIIADNSKINCLLNELAKVDKMYAISKNRVKIVVDKTCDLNYTNDKMAQTLRNILTSNNNKPDVPVRKAQMDLSIRRKSLKNKMFKKSTKRLFLQQRLGQFEDNEIGSGDENDM